MRTTYFAGGGTYRNHADLLAYMIPHRGGVQIAAHVALESYRILRNAYYAAHVALAATPDSPVLADLETAMDSAIMAAHDEQIGVNLQIRQLEAIQTGGVPPTVGYLAHDQYDLITLATHLGAKPASPPDPTVNHRHCP